MKKIMFTVASLLLLSVPVLSFAQSSAPKKLGYAPYSYVSTSPSDIVTVQNLLGYTLQVQITAFGTGPTSPQYVGVTVNNCSGQTVQLAPNSVLLCYLNPTKPITLSSETVGTSAGNIQVQGGSITANAISVK